jgi:hypothetical protein
MNPARCSRDFVLVIAYAIQRVFKVDNNSEHSATHRRFTDCGEFRMVAYAIQISAHQCHRPSHPSMTACLISG